MRRYQEQDIADDSGSEIQNEIACKVGFGRLSKSEGGFHIPLHRQKVENEV